MMPIDELYAEVYELFGEEGLEELDSILVGFDGENILVIDALDIIKQIEYALEGKVEYEEEYIY